MIASLSGVIAEKLMDKVIIDVNGVGYGVLVTVEDLASLSTGDQAVVYIYEHIRENLHELYGFTNVRTKELFEQLLDVNGVGPKMALNILSIGSSSTVKQAIAGGDVKLIQAANGVGKRVAERVIVELKDKVGLASTADEKSLFASELEVQKDEAVQALTALGYNVNDAITALKEVDSNLPTEERVKQALKGNSK